jgi:hypothetical protein
VQAPRIEFGQRSAAGEELAHALRFLVGGDSGQPLTDGLRDVGQIVEPGRGPGRPSAIANASIRYRRLVSWSSPSNSVRPSTSA